MMNPRQPSVAALHDVMALIEVLKSPEAVEQAIARILAAIDSQDQQTKKIEANALKKADELRIREGHLQTQEAAITAELTNATRLRKEYESKIERMRDLFFLD
jgi:hypothetical protein